MCILRYSNAVWTSGQASKFQHGILVHTSLAANFYLLRDSDWLLHLDRIGSLFLELLDAVDLAVQPFQAHRAHSASHSRSDEERDPLGRSENRKDGIRIAIWESADFMNHTSSQHGRCSHLVVRKAVLDPGPVRKSQDRA